MSALFAILAIILVRILWSRANAALYDDAFSPLNLMFYFWIAPIILCSARLSGLQHGLGVAALAVISACTLILITTCLLPALYGVGSRRYPLSAEKLEAGGSTPLLIIGFYFATFTALYFAEFAGHDLPLIVYLVGQTDDSALHTVGKDSKIQVLAFGLYAAAIFIFYLWLHETQPLRRTCYAGLAVLVVVAGLVKTSKSDVYIPVMSYAALFYYYNKSMRRPFPTRYKVVALAMLLAALVVTSLRLEASGVVGGYSKIIEFKYADELGAAGGEAAAIVYGYTALGFENFSNYIDSHAVVFRPGSSLLRPFLSMMMMGDLADSVGVPQETWNVVSSAANTGTVLTPLYIEGGPTFCMLGMLLYGLFVNGAYLLFRRTSSVRWMFIYVSLLFPWTWVFFTNAFSVLSTYVNVFYIWLLSIAFRKPARGVIALVVRSRLEADYRPGGVP